MVTGSTACKFAGRREWVALGFSLGTGRARWPSRNAQRARNLLLQLPQGRSLLRLLDEWPKLNLKRSCNSEQRIEGWVSQTTFHSADHGVGKPCLGSYSIHGNAKRLALLSQKSDRFRPHNVWSGLRHAQGISDNRVDMVCAYRHSFQMFARRLGGSGAGLPCRSTSGCPDIWELTDGDFAIIGTDITAMAAQLPPSAGCAPNERIVRIPRALLVRARSEIPFQV